MTEKNLLDPKMYDRKASKNTFQERRDAENTRK